MTWVIGASTIFGYGVVVSDICVTFPDGRTRDLVQKAYPVGKFIVAGFAGNVGMGFTLLRSLQEFLRSEEIERDECWIPEWVAENWAPHACEIYRRASAQQSIGDTHIIQVGIKADDPSKQTSLGGGKAQVSVLKSPDFAPDTVGGWNQIRSIGSGAGVDVYRQTLEGLVSEENWEVMQSEVGNVGGFGRYIGNTLARAAGRTPKQGISKYMHLFLIKLGSVERWDSPGMPQVARNWPELLTMIDDDAIATQVVAQAMGRK